MLLQAVYSQLQKLILQFYLLRLQRSLLLFHAKLFDAHTHRLPPQKATHEPTRE
jgi:hypothetical protein